MASRFTAEARAEVGGRYGEIKDGLDKPHSHYEVDGAALRDSGLDFDAEHPTTCEYDRRVLLNVIVALLDAAEAPDSRIREQDPPRLPGESPCVFDHGDGWASCRVHGWSGPPSQRSRVLVCPDVNAALEGDSRIRESALPDRGFAENRPTGPRTVRGHALARNLRDRDGEVDWDAWVREIESEAAALATPAIEPGIGELDPERLARAMAIVHMTDPAFARPVVHTPEEAAEHAGEWKLDAEAIAAAYREARP